MHFFVWPKQIPDTAEHIESHGLQGSARQRMFFVGGKASSGGSSGSGGDAARSDDNATLDVLALDVDEALLGSSAADVRWRQFLTRDSYQGHCSKRSGHVACSLLSEERRTNLDVFEETLSTLTQLNEQRGESKEKGSSSKEEEGSKESDLDAAAAAAVAAAAAASRSQQSHFIYVFCGEEATSGGRKKKLLNDMYRIMVWRQSDREPESIGRWEKVAYERKDSGGGVGGGEDDDDIEAALVAATDFESKESKEERKEEKREEEPPCPSPRQVRDEVVVSFFSFHSFFIIFFYIRCSVET